MVDQEIAQVRATGLECYKYGFFSRSGFGAQGRDDVALTGLSEMY